MATAAETKPRRKAAPKSAAATAQTRAPAPTSNLTGRVAQVIGAVVDVAFEGDLPPILTALETDNQGNRLVLELPKQFTEGIDPLAAWSSWRLGPADLVAGV